MSGTFPDSTLFRDTQVTSRQPRDVVTAKSGRSLARDMGGHLWSAKCQCVVMKQAEFAPIQAFMAKQRGDWFLIEIPPHNNAQGAVTGSVYIDGNYSEGATQIKIDGITSGLADAFKAGDMITISGHTKVYMCETDLTAGDGSLLMETGDYLLLETGDQILMQEDGQVTMEIYPALIQDITNDLQVTYDGVKFTMALEGDTVRDSYRAPSHSTYSFNLIEAL